MALARLNREVEKTTGRGNCAFNALALALCDSEVLDHIEDYFINSREEIEIALAEFINDMANTLRVEARWPALKEKLLSLREESVAALQSEVAPILRDLSITIMSRYEDALYQLHVYNEILRKEFSDFTKSDGRIYGQNTEKLFVRYPFISEKFEEVVQDPKLSKDPRIEQEEYLINWWWGWGLENDQEAGCRLFQNAIQASDKKGPPHSDRNFMQVANLLTANTIHHRQHMTMNLLSAYDFYKVGASGNGDDAFSRHKFITQKFADIKNEKLNEDQEQRALRGWWWRTGYRQFLRNMREDGEWAGDLELTILADYFRIAFFVISESDEKNLNKLAGNYGYFPHLNKGNCKHIPEHEWQHVKEVLIERMVIDHGREHKDGYDFLITSLDELKARLSDVPGLDGFDSYALERSDTLKDMIVPDGWPSEYLTYFREHKIIVKNPDADGYIFAVDGLTLREAHREWLESVENKPSFKGINEYIGRYTDGVKLKPVPAKFLHSTAAIEELIKRNVIERCFGAKDQYKFSVDAQTAKRRVSAIPHLESVLQIGCKHFQQVAEVVLYKTSDHWSNTLEKITPEERRARKDQRLEQRKLKRSISASSAMFNPTFFAGSTAGFIMRNIFGNDSNHAAPFVNRFT